MSPSSRSWSNRAGRSSFQPLTSISRRTSEKPLRMNARAGQPEDDVARRDPVAGQRLGPIDRADAEAGEVIVALGVHAGHFGRLAADQRAAGLAAAFGDRRDDRGGDVIVELPGRIIVEEEQRLGALDDEIVDAHRDEVDADPVMPAGLDRQLELGADAVIGGDQQRIFVAGRLQVEEAAESAELGIGARAGRSTWRAARWLSPARCRRRSTRRHRHR